MMSWSLELEVLAWLCPNIQIEIHHNQLNGRHVEIPNPGFFDDSIPMEFTHTLYEWLKFTFLDLKVNSKPLYNIISKLVSKGGYVFCYVFIPILNIYPWPWSHHPLMQTIIHVFYYYFSLFYCNLSFRNVNSTPPNIINNHLYPFLWSFPYSVALLHLA